ncbi:Acetoacetyl-CoA synthetase [Araneus ventricosus]|uniref:Acetoacetyl-CoA synthetase n=1 Tax=Araneus ventricosus TaxID=182803 RepID=A0A4Y2G0E2_ARAVE|nr:Acetoacetyl-CoA synthetase [Araneus ventricosus]
MPRRVASLLCARVGPKRDETLKQRGCRFGSSEIYAIIDDFPQIRDSMCVSHYNKHGDERAVLFLKMAAGHTFDNRLVCNIKKAIAEELTIRHVPDVVLETEDIPVNMNGKKMEIIVKKIINKMPYNDESVINPESLKNFMDVPELQNFERIFPNIMMLKGS